MTSAPMTTAFAAAAGALLNPSNQGEAINQAPKMMPAVSPQTAGLYIAKNASATIPAPMLHELQAVGSAPAATVRSHGEAISHTPRMTLTQSTQRRVVMTAPIIVIDAPLTSCPEARLDLGALANISVDLCATVACDSTGKITVAAATEVR